MIVKAALDIAANPVLMDACPKSVEFCRSEVGANETDVGSDHGKVEGQLVSFFSFCPKKENVHDLPLAHTECLKELFKKRALGRKGDTPQCIVEVAKLVETESLDIGVDRPLHEACSVDLAKFCRNVPLGESSS